MSISTFDLDGGAAEFGATNTYDGSRLVAESINQGSPIIFVAMNYRLNESDIFSRVPTFRYVTKICFEVTGVRFSRR